MSATVRIEAEFEQSQAVAGVSQLKGSIQSLPSTAQEAKSEFQKLWDSIARGKEASGKAAEGSRELSAAVGGVAGKAQLLTGVLAGLSGIALPALSFGLGIAISKLTEWITESREAADSSQELTDAISRQREELHKLQSELTLVGFKGAMREEEDARRNLERTQQALLQMRALLDKQTGFFSLSESEQAALGGRRQAQKMIDQTKGVIAFLESQEETWRARLALGMRHLVDEHAKAEEKRTEKSQKEYETRLKNLQQYLDATRKLEIAAISDPAARIAAQRLEDLQAAGTPASGVTQAAIEARQAAINAKAVRDLQALWIKQNKSIAPYDPLGATNKVFLDSLESQEQGAAEFLKRGKEVIKAWEREQDRLIDMNERMARDAENKFERAASSIEGFFNRVFLTARSFSDVWRQLWGQIANFAVNQIARMVAAWWTGQRSMTQAAVTGGYGSGGSSGGMAGGIQSVLSYASAGPAMATNPGTAAASLGAFGTSGMLAGMSGISTSDSIGSTGTGAISGGIGLGASFSNLVKSPAGLAMLGATGLNFMSMGITRGNMALAGISGFLGGGFTGLALGSSILAGTALGAWAGPIGALAGLGIGLFMAARKRGQQKRASASVHGQYNELQQQIISDYEQHRRGYDEATSSLTSAYESAVMALQSMGTPGSRTIREISGYYREGMAQMKALQARREGRLTDISGLPVPEFGSGSYGIIRTGSSGGFPAILHPNEAVLNERAAAALGDEAIKKLNSGKTAAGTMTVNLVFPDILDARGFERVLTSNIDALKKVIRRAAGDVGLPHPV